MIKKLEGIKRINKIKSISNNGINKIKKIKNNLRRKKKRKNLDSGEITLKGKGKKALLLIHGYTSTPQGFRRFAKYLQANGYGVRAPLLPGHGTVPEHLEKITWQEWLYTVEKEYWKLKERYSRVGIVGVSLGGNLSLLLASKYQKINGVVCIGTPMKLKFSNAYKTAILFSPVKKYLKKRYPKWVIKNVKSLRSTSYGIVPLKNIKQLMEVIEESKKMLSEVQCPVLILQAHPDIVIRKKSAKTIFEKISSENKRIILLKKAYHVPLFGKKERRVVFRETLNFFEQY